MRIQFQINVVPQKTYNKAEHRVIKEKLQDSLFENMQRTLDIFAVSTKECSHPIGQKHAIIVLGTRARNDGSPTPELQARIERAVQWAGHYPEAILLVTGGSVANKWVEADVMADGLNKLGVDASRIYKEPNARFTTENAVLSYALLGNRDAGPWTTEQLASSRLTIITEPFHGPRSLQNFVKMAKLYDINPTIEFVPAERIVPANSLNSPWTSRSGCTKLNQVQTDEISRCLLQQKIITEGF